MSQDSVHSTDDSAKLYNQFLAKNYAAAAITLVKGKGTRVWDAQGKTYLDFASGIAVNAVGHAHPVMVKKIAEQAVKLIHVSNLYRNEPQAKLAESLSKYCGSGRFLFCNSGAEANEALLKLARLHGKKKSGVEGKCIGIVVAEKAFHGRTFGGMSATPQEKIQNGFRPLLSGFSTAPLNDIKAWDKAISSTETAAVLLETIQGEGGVFVADRAFLRELHAICKARNVLFLIDEIQCGIGRAGKFFAYEHSGVKPDAIAMAKGLGGGLPLGAMIAIGPAAHLLKPGEHGSTFGGNPVSCAAGLAAIQEIEKKSLNEKALELGEFLKSELLKIEGVTEVRGRGLLLGIVLEKDWAKEIANFLMAKGVLVNAPNANTIRIAPPLIVTKAECSKFVKIFAEVIANG